MTIESPCRTCEHNWDGWCKLYEQRILQDTRFCECYEGEEQNE